MKFIVYLAIVIGFSSANAGSYEDFFRAVVGDNPRAIEALVERGFDPNAHGPDGQPALVRALGVQSYAAAAALIKMPGIDLELANPAGETPLMMAAIKKQVELARLLIDRGALINRTGWTPLHYAVAGDSRELVDLLLQLGARLDAQSPNGRTPLMMAALYASEEIVNRLLDAGADFKLVDHSLRTAAELAAVGDREWLAKKITARTSPAVLPR